MPSGRRHSLGTVRFHTRWHRAWMERRRPTRLRNYDYATAGAYFVTICTARRGAVFGDVVDATVRLNPLGTCAAACLAAVSDHHDVTVDTSIVMPDHVHAVVVLGLGHGHADLSTVIGTFKAAVTRASGRRGLWQRGFFDHIVRNDADLERVREYISTNPVRSLRRGQSGRIYPAPTQRVREPKPSRGPMS